MRVVHLERGADVPEPEEDRGPDHRARRTPDDRAQGEEHSAERELLDQNGAERDVEQRLAGGLCTAHLGDALVGEQMVKARYAAGDPDDAADHDDDPE